MPALVWFRSDLRTEDNTALHAACSGSSDGVIGLFVISPDEWRRHDVAAVRVEFILRTLAPLSARLAGLNIPLKFATAESAADVPSLVVALAQRHGCGSIHFNREYEVNEAQRDSAVLSLSASAGIRAIGYDDQTVVPPDRLRTGEGRYYTVFSPYKRAWLKSLAAEGIPPVLSAPGPQARIAVEPDDVPTSVSGFRSGVSADRWPAGERAAMDRLHAFAGTAILEYKDRRDYPGVEGTSSLSPYLAIGAISARQCLAAAIGASPEKRSPLEGGPAGVVHWISELVWREFYIAVMVGFPRVCKHRAFKPAADRIRWKDNDDHVERWKAGKTGVPIVDAGMRQLLSEGWMHNRVRMITAMYFSKNLFQDWRIGERHFMRHLVDGTLASNNGGWQWSASTGTDAAPYFRIFNPISQSERFDPEGSYIRRWVPELGSIAGEGIHDPGRLPTLLRSTIDYPEMLVDLSESRAAAIDAFRALG